MAKTKAADAPKKLRKYKMVANAGAHYEPIFDESGKIVGEKEHIWNKNPVVETTRDLMKTAVNKFERYFGGEEDDEETEGETEAKVEVADEETEEVEEEVVTEHEEEETLGDHTGQDEDESNVKPKVKTPKVVKKVIKKKTK